MPIELTTGTPGAGKTLFTVSEVLKPLVGQTIEVAGKAVARRLCIAGIPDLLIPHELVEAPPIHHDTFTDPWGEVVRRPGDAPVRFVRDHGGRLVACGELDAGSRPVPMLAENWWCWCQPGDVVVIDECQTVFRPMSAGRKSPAFIRALEVHRHYGIDFVLVTQHPQLLHTAVRSLVGKHRHVRRLFGRGAAIVYEWDRCSPPERVRDATSRIFRYKRKAFELYKSAQVHTKQSFRVGFVFVALVVAVLATPVLWWFAMHRGVLGGVSDAEAVAAKSLQQLGASPQASPATSDPAHQSAPVSGPPAARWPRYALEPVQGVREPLGDLAVVLEGEWEQGGKRYGVFGLWADGQRVVAITLADLSNSGYTWQRIGPCLGMLLWQGQSRPVTCGPRAPLQVAAPLGVPATPL